MVRLLHQITNIIEPWIIERPETHGRNLFSSSEGLHKRHCACSDNAQCESGPAAL